jgi:Holliday junction resolvase RusA-like endonuclease
MFTKSGMAYTPKKKRDYQKELISSFKVLHQDFETPITTPVMAVWTFFCLRPKSIKKDVMIKSSRPDTDGFLKTVKDVIQDGPLSRKAKKPIMGLGIVKDDALIFCELVQKVYVSDPNQQAISLICQTNQNTLNKNSQYLISPKQLLFLISATTKFSI